MNILALKYIYRLILFRLLSIIFNVVYCIFLNVRGSRMEYISITKMSEKWGISPRRIRVLCNEGRISGACKKNAYWVIPDDAEKPKDERIKSGKYIKYQI